MEKDYNFGISFNGPSFKFDKLSPLSNSYMYNYFCNVSRVSHYNGNGTYDVTITDSHFKRGCPVGKWKIVSGKIEYCWVSMTSSLVMMDEYGRETIKIIAQVQKVRQYHQDYDIESVTRAIFSKAVEISSRFPSSEIYNAYKKFMDCIINDEYVKVFKDKETKSESIEYFFDESLPKIKKYFELYTDIHNLLNPEDEYCKPLLVEIEDKMYNFLSSVFKK